MIIEDFDPLFKHTNDNTHNKNLRSFKMNYSNFLEESGLFKLIYKIRNNLDSKISKDKNFFKSNDSSFCLYQKLDFKNAYPENI